MDEFELCLKEFGILGTHAFVGDGKANTVAVDLLQASNTLTETTSFYQEITPNEQIACGSTKQIIGSTQNLTSDPSDSENAASEEDMSSESKDGQQFVCSVCHENLPSKNEMKAHLKSHSSERPYVCPVCQKSFRHLNVLRTHSRVHTGVVVYFFFLHYSLFECSTYFVGEKPFSCSTCNRAFSHKSTLNEHMNLHSDDRPYACEKCQRRFKQRKSLRAHRCE